MVWTENAERVLPTSGPLMAWLLTPAILAGGAEWVAHLVQLLFLAVAIAATVALALRLGLSPAWSGAAGLLLAATPASLAMAGTAMADVPAMALGVAGLERLLAWRDERTVLRGVLAALLLGLAALARSHLLLVVGVGALLLVGDFWRRRAWLTAGWRPWVPAAASVAVFAGVLVITRDPEAATGLVGTTLHVSLFQRGRSNLAAYLTHWVLALPLALPWCVLRLRELLERWWVLVIGIALSALLLVGTNAPPAFAPIPGLGLAVLVDVAIDGWRRRDAVQLALWGWLLVGLLAVPYAHLPAKYLLASAPAVALLVAREASSRGGRRAIIAVAPAAVVGVALGIAILRADAVFAGVGRRAAVELVGRPAAAGQRVWFTPHWGFQWYAERAGGQPMTLKPPHPAPGDLVVTSDNTDQSVLVLRALSLSYPGRLQPLARIEERGWGGRIMDANLNAGFFSNAWGFLPWAWGDGLVDGFDLLRIE
jgi:4-amino-4-deoxy-L-arabinose transferase-like glycosyltransferase